MEDIEDILEKMDALELEYDTSEVFDPKAFSDFRIHLRTLSDHLEGQYYNQEIDD